MVQSKQPKSYTNLLFLLIFSLLIFIQAPYLRLLLPNNVSYYFYKLKYKIK